MPFLIRADGSAYDGNPRNSKGEYRTLSFSIRMKSLISRTRCHSVHHLSSPQPPLRLPEPPFHPLRTLINWVHPLLPGATLPLPR